jgi:hypothetical protein
MTDVLLALILLFVFLPWWESSRLADRLRRSVTHRRKRER